MEPETSTFEDDPIYVVAPKPTTFKIVLHNGQIFFLQFMGKAYEATVEGKRYYLMAIGEKERCMVAISRLLRFGSPLKTKGPEGAEQAPAGGPDEEAGPTPPSEKPAAGEEGGEEELTEATILEAILKEADTDKATLFESALVYAWYKLNNLPVPKDAILPEELTKLKSNKNMVEKAGQAIIDLCCFRRQEDICKSR